ncbi:TolC family protein [Pedobacter soli]|uniref:Outer membrane protein TolC n=1 Tax=Pedobacter soli TaxID=390242 RepID=A0A1G6TIS0_9SPHI|nr:TolC family protein [Pedobacter soli]SDD28754.1 Outer membrane protein TolC [Pedobacter soli]
MNFRENKNWISCFLGFLLLPVFVRAQEVTLQNNFSISQIWAMADSNSKKIKVQHLGAEAADAHIKVSQAERLPEIAAEGIYAHVFPLPIYENGLFHTPAQFPVVPTYYKASADTYFNIYNGGKTNTEINASKVESELKHIQSSQNKQEIHYVAAVYFYDVFRNISYRGLLEQDIRDREKQLAEINHLYKNGTILKSDVLRAELRLSKQRMLLSEIENSIKIAKQKLNILIGRPDDAPLNPQITANETDAIALKQVDEYFNDAKTSAYKIRISEKEQALAELKLKNIRSNVMPSLGFFGEYAFAYPQIQFYPYALSLYSTGMVGLKLKIPISSWYTNQHKVKEAQIKLHQQEVEDEDVKDNIRQEVQENYIRYKESVQRISVAEENIKQAAESYRIVQNTYFNQLSLLTDLLDAETQLLQSRFELTTAKVNAKIQYYQLQKAIGNL